MSNSLMVADLLARRLVERTQPEEAIKVAVAQIVEGFRTMARLGFTDQEVYEAYCVWMREWGNKAEGRS